MVETECLRVFFYNNAYQGFEFDTPNGSVILNQCPITSVAQHSGTTLVTLDQCLYGDCDPEHRGMLMKKMTKPVTAGGTLSTFLNECVQADWCELCDRIYATKIDEVIRLALTEYLNSNMADDCLAKFGAYRTRYLAPPRTIVSD